MSGEQLLALTISGGGMLAGREVLILTVEEDQTDLIITLPERGAPAAHTVNLLYVLRHLGPMLDQVAERLDGRPLPERWSLPALVPMTCPCDLGVIPGRTE